MPIAPLTSTDLATVRNLVTELATELDLHYEASDGPVLRRTVCVITAGRELHARFGEAVHGDVDATIAKFQAP
jgi:hypothetical protein